MKQYESLEALREDCLRCTACGLCETRTNVVFGRGNPNAKLLFVGEGPGEQEDKTGEPFVGRAGQLLDQYLEVMGFTKDDYYIANIVKCRPPQNRDPSPKEQDCCIGYLREQVRLIRPKIIACLGRIAAMRIIDKNYKVTKQHGEMIRRGNLYLTGTFHPAALLRTPSNKPLALGDFQKIREQLRLIESGGDTL